MSATKRKAGRPRGRTYPVRLQLTLNQTMAQNLADAAKQIGWPVNQLVRHVISMMLVERALNLKTTPVAASENSNPEAAK